MRKEDIKIGMELVRTVDNNWTGAQHWFDEGYRFVAVKIEDGYYVVDKDGYYHSHHKVEPTWQPEVGETIEVKNNPTIWYKREYRGMVDGYYITKAYTGENLRPWKDARPIKKRKVLICEETGKRYILSEGSSEILEEEA